MRKPFIISNGGTGLLTGIQSRRRARWLVRSKCYREYLMRQRRNRKRSPRQRKLLPDAPRLFTRYASLANPRIALLTQAIEALDDGRGKPHEQLMLELEIWMKTHRALIDSRP